MNIKTVQIILLALIFVSLFLIFVWAEENGITNVQAIKVARSALKGHFKHGRNQDEVGIKVHKYNSIWRVPYFPSEDEVKAELAAAKKKILESEEALQLETKNSYSGEVEERKRIIESVKKYVGELEKIKKAQADLKDKVYWVVEFFLLDSAPKGWALGGNKVFFVDAKSGELIFSMMD